MSDESDALVPGRPARVDLLLDVAVVIEDLVGSERENNAAVVKEVDLVLLEDLMTHSTAVDVREEIALENAPREGLLEPVRVIRADRD